MFKTQNEIKYGFSYLKEFQLIHEKLGKKYTSLKALNQQIIEWTVITEALNKEIKEIRTKLNKLYELWGQRPWYLALFNWVPAIRRMQDQKNAHLLNQWEIKCSSDSDKEIENYFKSILIEKKTSHENYVQHIFEYQTFKTQYLKTQKKLTDWIEKHSPEVLHSKKYKDQINDICDKILRFELFKLATHYWESKWLVETKQFIFDQDEDKKTPTKLRRKYLRFAKLTPCFVSTFFMAPSFFMAFEKRDKVWKKIPLFNEIDLLIVDESGQALADVSSASFALSKRALIVGDTDQIEPVWNIPPSVDIANLKLSKLITDSLTYDNFWIESGLLSSSGNLMRVAQRRCKYHQYTNLQRGLYLTEHRRCYNNIISYCNDLVYKNTLEPLRGEPNKELPWPSMKLIHTMSPSKKMGGSRGNPGEAKEITNWLKLNHQKIINYGRESIGNPKDKNDDEILLKTVAIVTPFSKQSTLIKKELREANFPDLTVGTVHKLQGDERTMVLFSSVYGLNEKSASKFYDQSNHMLNVAVSRAKNIFLVFGDPNVFGISSSMTPSGILRKYLVDE